MSLTVTLDVALLEEEVQDIGGVGDATAEKICEVAKDLDEPEGTNEIDRTKALGYLRHGKERELTRLLKE